MVSALGSILSAAQKSQLTSIQSTQRLIDDVQLRLASGKLVNSAIDDPQNFFTARALDFRASDLGRRLDGIGQSIRTVQEADQGVQAVLELLDLVEATVDESLVELYSSDIDSLKTELSPDDITRILTENPGVVYNAPTESFYQYVAGAVTADAAFATATTTELDGVAGHVANITSVAENNFVRGIIGGEVWIGASDRDSEGRWVWTDGPEADLNFWNGTSGGSVVPGEFASWSGGEPNNSGGNEDYVVLRTNGLWNDLRNTSTRAYVIEWDESLFISDVDPALTARAAEYSVQYSEVLAQIDRLVIDAQYRGINLLADDDLETIFNEDATSRLFTNGIDASALGLGLTDEDFLTRAGLNKTLDKIDSARQVMRRYLGTLQNDLSVIEMRDDFTRGSINTLLSGSDDLVVADQNRVGAEFLALQVRQSMQSIALSLGAQSERAVLSLF